MRVLPRPLVAISSQIVENSIVVKVMVIDEFYGLHGWD